MVYTPFNLTEQAADLDALVLTYTSLNTYYFRFASSYLNPYPDYNADNLMLSLKALGVNPANVSAYLTKHQTEFNSYFGWLKYSNSDLIKKYDSVGQMSFLELLAKYPVDYIIIDGSSGPGLIKQLGLYQDQPVFTANNVAIYKVKRIE